MKTRFLLIIIIGLVNLFWITSSFAEGEQWLQYGSARESSQMTGITAYRELEIIKQAPAGIQLPQLKSKDAIFARWTSPLAKGGGIWLALDRTRKYGGYDLLYIDSNGDGNLKDETAVKPYETGQNYSYFGPVKLLFEGEDGPITYHLNLYSYASEERKILYALSACWYEGTVTVQDAKKKCLLIDFDVNGTFDDKNINPAASDRIRIAAKDSDETKFVGKYV